MTLREMSAPDRDSPLNSLCEAVEAGIPAHSRRDMLRAMAVLGGSSTIGTGVAAAPVDTGAASARGVIQDDDVETDADLALPLYPFGQPVTIDPHRTVNWGPFWVLLPYVWAGPVRFDENGAVEPDLAESVEPGDDATLWIVTLKSDLKFASGRTITAEDCVASWKRALDPRAVSPMAAFMSNVEGFEGFIAGDSTEIGFAATDELTVEIRLAQPDSSFPSSLATFVWAVVDIDAIGDGSSGDSLMTEAGAGAWQITEFVDGERLVMTSNAEYWAKPSPSITRIVWHILDGEDAESRALDMFRSGELGVADVPLSQLPEAENDDALSESLIAIESQASTMAIGLDFNQEPFSDVRVRRAVAAAIDRETWASDIWQGSFVPAESFVPPVVGLTSDYTAAVAEFGEEASAPQLLDEAGLDPDQNAPEIVYFQPATDAPDDIERHSALLRMIEDNSGLVIEHDTSLTSEQISARQRDQGGRQFDIVWWWTVSETAALLDTAASPDSPSMRGWFNWNPDLEVRGESDPGAAASAFQDRISEAKGSLSADDRNDAYREAERLLLANAVYIPLGHWVQRFVQQAWLQGTRQGPWSGSIPVRIDAEVAIRCREN